MDVYADARGTGEKPKLLVSGSDVTERAQHEDRIQRERDYFGALFDATPSFICVVDHEGSMTSHSLNTSMIALTRLHGRGGSRAALRGGLLAPRGRGARSGHDRRGHSWRGSGGTGDVLADAGRSPGARRMDLHATPEREAPDRLLISGVDVTERKQREEEQAALRRVAVAVASEQRPEDVFQTVTEEAGRLLGADAVQHGPLRPRRQRGPGRRVLAARGRRPGRHRDRPADRTQGRAGLGRPATPGGPSGSSRTTPNAAAGLPRTTPSAELTTSVVTAPVLVAGRVWGAVSVTLNEGSFPPETEERDRPVHEPRRDGARERRGPRGTARLARADRRGRGRRAPPARAEPPRRGPAAARVALALATARTGAAAHGRRGGRRDPGRRQRRAGARPRGAARARARHPPGGADRPGARAGARVARRPHACAGQPRERSDRSACPRPSRRPRSTSSPRRSPT